MVCPILISVSVMPGAFSARASPPVPAMTASAVTRINVLSDMRCLLLFRVIYIVWWREALRLGSPARSGLSSISGARPRRSSMTRRLGNARRLAPARPCRSDRTRNSGSRPSAPCPDYKTSARRPGPPAGGRGRAQLAHRRARLTPRSCAPREHRSTEECRRHIFPPALRCDRQNIAEARPGPAVPAHQLQRLDRMEVAGTGVDLDSRQQAGQFQILNIRRLLHDVLAAQIVAALLQGLNQRGRGVVGLDIADLG